MLVFFSYYDKSCRIACVYSADPLADVPLHDCRREGGSAQAIASSWFARADASSSSSPTSSAHRNLSSSPTSSARRDWVVAPSRLSCSDFSPHDHRQAEFEKTLSPDLDLIVSLFGQT